MVASAPSASGTHLWAKLGQKGLQMTRARLIVVTAVLVVAGVAWISGQPRRPSDLLSPNDAHEIEQLVQGYTKGIDLGPEDASWVFARDAVFVYNDRSVTGEKELKAFYANLRQGNRNRTIRHVLSNLVVKATPGGGATGSVYLTTIEAPGTITAVGMYEDTFVKTAEGWRIKRRLYRQDLPVATAKPQ
jgi:hypothetical protein